MQKIILEKVLIIFVLCAYTTLLYAQYPTDYKDRPIPTNPQQQTNSELDTLSPDVYYFYLENPSKTTLLKEKELHNFHIYNPVRRQEYDHIQLGNFGSASKSIVYQPRFHKGFDAGFHSFDAYAIFKEDIRFYKLEKAYSDVAFSQGASQEQTNFSGKFSKNISPSTNIGLDYKRINNKGQYSQEQNKNTGFSINGWHQSTSGNYQAYASYTTNTIQQLENGGVDLNDETNILRKSILSVGRPVNTTTGESRYFQRALNFSHYYRLDAPANDSLIQAPIKDRQYTLFHQLLLKKNTYKYADELAGSVDEFYDPFLLDDRGVRQYMDIRQYENTFSIRTFQTQKANKLLGRAVTTDTKDLIELGLTHTFTDISQEPVDSSVHNVFLFGKIQFTPSEKLKINTYAHLGVLKQAGDYYVKGDFLLNLPKIGKLTLGIIAQHYSPSLLQQQLYITQQNIWKNNFKKTFENSFHASYYFPFLRLQVKGQLHVLSNYIYYDENALAQQTNEEVSIAQLIIENDIQWKGLNLENSLYIQSTTQKYLRLPSYYSIHRLSYTNTLFKKQMEYQVGAQVRIHTPYFMDGYQPLIGQFYLQNQQQNTYHPNIDAFVNVKIKDFRFFVNAQNIYDYFTTNFYYPVYQYPQFDSTIRFGFRWMFLD